jgi:predicted ATP-grasp superfamily ATP-dependent carboligase
MTRTLAPPRPPEPDFLQAVVDGLVPYGAAAIEVYEACVRAGEDLQRATARAVRFAPAEFMLTRSAELTRDLGAAHASWGRWLLGL